MTRGPSQAGTGAPPAPSAIRGSPLTTFEDLMRANRRKSVLLVGAMIALGVVIGGAIGAIIGGSGYAGSPAEFGVSAALGAGAALIVASLGATWSWFGGDRAILAMAGAKQIEPTDDPPLFNVVDELRLAAGLPMPRVYLIDSDALNAFATGRDPKHAAVAITRGLRERLTRDELAGVMAHEMSHVRHLDIRLAMLMATMVGLIVMASDAAWRMLRWGPRRRSSSSKEGNAAMLAVFLIALLLTLIAAPLAMLIQFAFSRQREYLADAGAVSLTRNPEGLIGALRKLRDCTTPLPGANRAISHLFIVSPLKRQMKAHQELNSLMSTHPPMHERIERLEALLR